MSKTPLISFIIPVYQKPPEVFKRCLESIFDPSAPKNIEVLCIFDGANEQLQDIADGFKKVVSFVMEHAGAPAARNTGLNLARGEYVWFLDSDVYLKPGHVARMMDEFKAVPDADFVYSGYEGTEGAGEFASESFDAYSLTCGNYISSMAPIRRSKAPKWDETLDAAQDWDYWLTAVENGCKGVFVEGSGFIADTPSSGISSKHWNAENRDKTISIVREKHGIKGRDIGVFSVGYYERAIKVAKILGADVIKQTGPTPTGYKTIINIGYNFMSRFEGLREGLNKIQYWVPGEIEALASASYKTVMETIRVAKGVHNFCNTDYEKNKLSELGITAEVVPLPLTADDLAKVSTTLPEKFTVLVATDKAYSDLLKEIAVDLPHINFVFNAAKTADVSCLVSFYQFAALDNPMLIAHVNGRHVISNVQAPYCGFIDPDQTWEAFKKDLYDKIAEVRHKPLNVEAQDHYLKEASPYNLIKKLMDYRTELREVA